MNEVTTQARSGHVSMLKDMAEDQIISILSASLYPGANPASIGMVLGYCRAAGLDPMQKPVHIVPMWDGKAGQMRDVVMPGIGLYRVQASRSQQMAGISEPEFGPIVTQAIGGQEISFPEWCRVTVKRLMPNGLVAEFTAVEYWLENYAIKGGKDKSVAPNAMWTKRPRGQIAKCAEAQALRKAFPEIGAMPTAEEMEGRALDSTESAAPQVQAAQEQRQERPAWPAEAFATQLPRWTKAVEAGVKTPAEILAMARSRGTLSAEQEAQINAIKTPAVEVQE